MVEGGSEIDQSLLDADVTDDEVREVAVGLRKEWEEKAEARGEARGRAEGEARGRAEGEARGRAELLLKLLQLKFGALSDAAIARVRAASTDELDRWGERVLTAEALDDVWR